MPYAPGINDISGQLLAQGITSAAESAAAGHEKYLLTQKEIAALTGTATFAAQKGLLTPEELAEFNAGNIGKKREIASKAGMLYKDYLAEEERKVLQLTPEDLALYGLAGQIPVRTGPHSFAPAPLPTQKPEAKFIDLKMPDGRVIKVVQQPDGTIKQIGGDPPPPFQPLAEERAQWEAEGYKWQTNSTGSGNYVKVGKDGGYVPGSRLKDPDGREVGWVDEMGKPHIDQTVIAADLKAGTQSPVNARTGQPRAAAPGGAAEGGFASADAVKAAVNAGKLSRQEAVEILRRKFGFK